MGEKVIFSNIESKSLNEDYHEVVLCSRRNGGTTIGRLDKVYFDWDVANKALTKLIKMDVYDVGMIRTMSENGDVSYLGLQMSKVEKDYISTYCVQDMLGFFIGNRKLDIIQAIMKHGKVIEQEVLNGNYEIYEIE